MNPDLTGDLTVRGHHLEVTPELHAYVTEKIGSLRRFSGDITLIEVELTFDASGREGNAYRADARIHLTGPDLRAEEAGRRMEEAIDLLEDKLKRQLLRHKERREAKRRPRET